MTENHEEESSQSIIDQIKSSRREVTLLFTDIEGSTHYWDEAGDIKGRLMIDRHNRLLFPAVKKFHGSIIKTIGDAIMASFKKPKNALKAAIAIQQILERERERNPDFQIKVRIGIHTGDAVVEKRDVYGDAVNVASRIEGEAKGSEILLSRDTSLMLKEGDFRLKRHGSFMPRGKTEKMEVYRCDWKPPPLLASMMREGRFLPVPERQKYELLLYLIVASATYYFIYLEYIRYFLMDYEQLAYLLLNPRRIDEYPLLLLGIAISSAVLLSLLIILFIRIKTVPVFILRLLKGFFGASIVFGALYLLIHLLPPGDYLRKEINKNLNHVIHESQYLLVKVVADEADILYSPSMKGEVIHKVKKGKLLLLIDLKKGGKITWNRVSIGRERYGWIARVIPPRMGVPAKRVTNTKKFYFRNLDLYTLALSLIGFLWGMLSFRVRPV